MARARTPRDRIGTRAAKLDAEIAEAERQVHALTVRLDDETATEAARLVVRALHRERQIVSESGGSGAAIEPQ